MQIVSVRGLAPNDPRIRYCARECRGWVGSPLGNPYSHMDIPGTITVASRQEAIRCYRLWLWELIKARDPIILGELSRLREDDVLGCWCGPGLSCHCEVIIKAWRYCLAQGIIGGSYE